MSTKHLILVVLILVFGAGPAPTEAQADPDYLLLARICAHEAGWDAFNDCPAIYAVLMRNAERHGYSFRSAAYAYSGRALRGETSRSYYAGLNEEGTRPEGWPATVWVRRGDVMVTESGPAWSNYRDRWLALLAHARAIVAGDVTHSCAETPDDWGGRVDRRRAATIGLIEIDCGDTRNDFYVRPSTRRAAPPLDYVPPDDVDPE